MPYIESETHGMFDTGPENYTILIDKYFETPFNNCDYRINHFLVGTYVQIVFMKNYTKRNIT